MHTHLPAFTNRAKTVIFALLFSLFCAPLAAINLLPAGSTWKYLDNGTDQGTAWRGTSFNDGPWASGPAQLGYGDGDEATVVSYGSNASNKYVTTYFRHTFNVVNASQYTSYTLQVRRDDGVVVYVNGTEVYRSNMPGGTILYNTWASGACSDDGGTWQSTTLAAGTFVTGSNTIAVEIHQNTGNSSDISFDLQLDGAVSGGANITRGPYLQKATQNSIVIRWRTDVATNSWVQYDTVYTSYANVVNNSTSTTEHEIQITGLLTDRKYYYTIGTSTVVLQGDQNNFFYTLPPVGTERKFRIWATGDCGTGYATQTSVMNQYMTYVNANGGRTDAWILLGDNAYNSGLDNEFQAGFYDMYPARLKNMTLWPAPGNHDYYSISPPTQASTSMPYYQMFTLPTAGEAGGVASGSEAYYSYDIGNIHMISLDSYGEQSGNNTMWEDTSSTMVNWVKADLAATTQKWKIAYWHHPPYTKGSHNSDTEGDLVDIRGKFIRILERYGIDLVLCGHSHCYERSYFLDGYYTNETSFNLSTHAETSSSGKYDGTSNSCPYIKNSPTLDGTVYVVAGSAGKFGGTSSGWPHNAMVYADETRGGSLVLEVDHNRLDAFWICDDGVTRDRFTMMKDVNQNTSVSIGSGQPTPLTSSWIGNYIWAPVSGTTQTVTVSPTSSTTYFVTDNYNCLHDTFNVNVTIAPPVTSFTASATTICAGQSISFTDQSTNNPTSWNWNFPGGSVASSTQQNPGSITWTSAGTYTVSLTATNAGGSSNSTQVITVNALPNVGTSASNTSICTGSSTTLTGSGAATYAWMPGTLSGNTVNVSPTATTTYTVTGTTASGCSNTQTITITVNNLPAVNASAASSTICSGDNITLSGSGAATYAWMPGALNGTTVNVSPTATTTYTLTGTAANGCSNTQTITITVNNLPAVNASAANSTLCAGDNTTLSGSGAATYAWMPGALSGTTVNVSPTATTSYTVTGTAANGCSNTQTITITVNNLPAVNASAANSTLCAGDNTMLTGSGAATYAWMPGALSGTTVNVSPTATTSYTVTGTAANGCSNTNTISITVNNLPAVSATASNNTICTGNNTTLTGSGAATYTWMPGALSGTTVNVSPASTTSYTVTGTDVNGCSNTHTISIIVNNLPIVTLNLANDTVCLGSGLSVLNGGSPAGGNYSGPGVSSGNFDPMAAGVGTHTIQYDYTDPNGCSGAATQQIFVDVCTSILYTGQGSADVTLFPNPAREEITLQIRNAPQEPVSLRLIDALGRVQRTETIDLSKKTSLVIDLNKLKSGVYFVELNFTSGKWTGRFVKE